MPSITIIIPVYNAAAYLARCLDSMLAQTYTGFELLLVVDGATDDSLPISLSYAAKDKRVKVISQDNKGASAARNEGLRQAKGTFVGFVDADDWLEPRYVEQLFAACADDVDLVCCGYYDYSIHAVNVPVHDFGAASRVLDRKELMASLLLGTAGVPWAKLFRRSIITDNNIIFPLKVKMSEDLIFNLNYALYVGKAAIIPDYLYHYNRLNEQSLSAKMEESYIQSYEMVQETLQTVLQKSGLDATHISQYLNNRADHFFLRLCRDIAADPGFSVTDKKLRIAALIRQPSFKHLPYKNTTLLVYKQLLQSKIQYLKIKVKSLWR